MDLCIGIHEPRLHPRTEACIDNICLLTSIFGTGALLDGNHEAVSNSPVLVSREAFKKTHASQY